MKQDIFLDSSMVEHSAVNRVVVGSSPTRGVFLSNVLIRQVAITRGSMVKRLRHRPFTAVTRVRFPLESFNLTWRSSQVVRQWSATPVSTGSNPVCASPEGPQKCNVSGVFSCPENLCVTNLYIAETYVKYSV